MTIISALLLILSSLAACGDGRPIPVGFSGQLTGKMSDIGVYGRNGAMLAVEHINAAGGINGRPLKLIVRDDGNTPEAAIAADRELMDLGVVAIIGHMTSSQTLAALPQAAQEGVLLISPTTSTPQLSGIKDNFVRVLMDNQYHGRELAAYARNVLDLRRVVSIVETDNASYSKTFEKYFSNAFEEYGGILLRSIPYSAAAAIDWKPVMAELSGLNPDGILLTCPAQDFVTLAQNIRSAGLTARLLSGAWAYTENLLHWGGNELKGSIFVIDFAADNPSPEYVAFSNAYKRRFGNTPNFASAFAYESVLALAAGLRKTGGSAQGLLEAMAPSEPIKGVVGTFSIDQFGDVNRDIFIVTVRDGQFSTIGLRQGQPQERLP
ncbi:ABC transporter substrate-binding protein [Pseudodesulfovibrio alkaliphilus]|uniref:ABC transporter substrate-binding protein n=1 Tax=Pseudodesulfovibrio alkaliphilus TaxID=2661613 RepID=UPI001E54C16D|nr:ABC transporter substrate-binding protein [Pseudodesulfovibrio alkaliphilus]